MQEIVYGVISKKSRGTITPFHVQKQNGAEGQIPLLTSLI